MMRRRLRLAAIAVLVGTATVATGVAITTVAIVRTTPPLDLAPARQISTTVTDANGRLLRAYTAADGRWRLPVRHTEVDPRYLDMLFAFEDRRFHHHSGVDPIGLARAAMQAVRGGRIVSGGSTLTMQVARLVHGRHDRSLAGKMRQMRWAIDLEQRLSKRAILDHYLRLAPFGGNIEGVRAATLSYFGKEPRHLTIAEAALLVALPQSPERRRPDRHPDAARSARDHVLRTVAERGVISEAERDRAMAQPVPSARKPFPMHAAHLADDVVAADPDRHTHRLTLDRPLQAALENLTRARAAAAGRKLSAAIIVAEHATGHIRAHVGSAGYLDARRLGAIDMTRAIRSPGSTLKPMVYGLAFDAGLVHPATLIDDVPTRFGTYAPKNFDESFNGTVTIADALARSLNVPAVKVLDRLGPNRLAGALSGAGLTLQTPNGAGPSLAVALGGIGMRLWDLAELYTAFAGDGAITPLTVTHARAARSPHRLVRARTAAWITDILRNAPPPPGGRRGHIAFKTGTSYGHRDAWAVGYDGRHVIAVWIGRADGTATPGLIGRTHAAPILFDAFARISETRAPFANRTRADTTAAATRAGDQLPPPLRRFERTHAHTANAAFRYAPVRIVFPPDRATVAVDAQAPQIILKAEGGRAPLSWLINGAPIDGTGETVMTTLAKRDLGFVKLTVIDRDGRLDRATIRLAE